jgi:hypothetical protein
MPSGLLPSCCGGTAQEDAQPRRRTTRARTQSRRLENVHLPHRHSTEQHHSHATDMDMLVIVCARLSHRAEKKAIPRNPRTARKCENMSHSDVTGPHELIINLRSSESPLLIRTIALKHSKCKMTLRAIGWFYKNYFKFFSLL